MQIFLYVYTHSKLVCCFLLDHSIWFIPQQEQVRIACDATVYKLKFHLTEPFVNMFLFIYMCFAYLFFAFYFWHHVMLFALYEIQYWFICLHI